MATLKELTTLVNELQATVVKLQAEVLELRATRSAPRSNRPSANDLEAVRAAMAKAREEAMRTGKAVRV